MSRMATSMRSGSAGGTEPSTRTYSKKWFIDHPILSAGGLKGWERRISPCTELPTAHRRRSYNRSRGPCPIRQCAVCASGGLSSARTRSGLASDDAVLGLGDDEVDHVAQVAAPFECRELPVRAGIAAQDLARVVDVVARAELVNHVIHELE